MNERGIENLGNAVVLQAVKDYRRARRGYGIGRKPAEAVIKECERFFLSDHFNIFSTLDGEILLERLKKEDIRRRKVKQITHK